MKRLIYSKTCVKAADYNPHLITVSPKDQKYILKQLNKSHKTLGDYGAAGDPRYWVSEFEPSFSGRLWASDKGLEILDQNGIEYEMIQKAVDASSNPFYDKLSDKDKRFANNELRKDYPYQIVSMPAILRDHIEPKYIGKFHKQLVDVADSLYNVGRSIVDDFLPEYKETYDRMGAEYWDMVLDDMYALDGQLTSQNKVDELVADYEDRLDSSALSFANASTKVTANTALTKDEIKNLWDNTALYVDFGDSDAMCQDNGYTLDQTLDFVDQGYSVYVDAATDITASRWYYREPMTEQELADLEADILALPGCDKLDMDTRDMEEIGYIMLLPGYNDIPLSDPQYYEKRKQLLKDILRVAKEHGLSRTEDRIEDYGSCWYIVLRTNKPKTDYYDEY